MLINLFVIIFAGLLGGIAFIEETSSYLALGGFVLSLIGLFSIHATRVPFLRFSRMAEAIMTIELGLGEYRRFFREEAGSLAKARDKSWTLHHTFIAFYSLAGGGWLSLFAHLYIQSYCVLAAILIAIAAILYFMYRVIFWRRELEVEEQLKNLITDLSARKRASYGL